MDVDINTALEVAGEASKGLNKFQDIISKIFNPRWTIKQADADAYADQKKPQTIRENPDMEIVYVDGKLNARQCTQDALAFRAEQRRIAEAVRQEANIEKVLEVTAKELSAEENISDEPVDEDWITRFFSIVKDINNEEMQYVWGQILAGEITTPKSFSLKTLDVLRNISVVEAQAFQRLIPLIFSYNDIIFVSSENEILMKYGSSFSDILLLDECGLVNSSGTLSLNLKVTKNKSEFIFTDEVLIAFNDNSDDEVKVSIGIHTLTKAGRELYSVLAHSTNVEYVKEVAQHIFEDNKKIEKVAVHKLYSLTTTSEGSHFTYKEEPEVFYDRAKNVK